MNLRYKKWLGVAWRVLLASMVLALIAHPQLQELAPIADLLGSLGLDGILLLIDLQLAMWLLPMFKIWVVPFLTKLWNRFGAPSLGMSPSKNVVADASLSFFHAVLFRGGHLGLGVYLVYIAMTYHVTVISGVPLA